MSEKLEAEINEETKELNKKKVELTKIREEEAKNR